MIISGILLIGSIGIIFGLTKSGDIGAERMTGATTALLTGMGFLNISKRIQAL